MSDRSKYEGMRNPNDLHTALVLFTAEAYLSQGLKDGTTQEEWHKQVVTSIEGWKTFRRFSGAEVKFLQDMGKDEVMEKIKSIEISFVVYALVLLQLLANDPDKRSVTIGISKKKLRRGDSIFVVPMLQTKKSDPQRHERLKRIIDESRINAKTFYHYTQNKIREELKNV